MSTSRFLNRATCALIGLFAFATFAHAAQATLDDKGIAFSQSPVNTLTFSYPTLENASQQEAVKVLESHVAGGVATIRYNDGATLTAKVDGDAVSFSFASVPASVKYFSLLTFISIDYSNGGSFKFGAGPEKPFPREKPAKPHIFQGNESEIALKNPEGQTLFLTIPSYSYCDLQDNREWNWTIYQLKTITPYDHNVSTYTFRASDSGPARPVLLVDQFGQSALRDYPTKVKSLDELKADVAADQAYYATFSPRTFDPFGGLPDSGEKLGLHKTGVFHCEKNGDRWILVDPAGNAFFHLGVCSFGPGEQTVVRGREDSYAWLPPHTADYKAAFNYDGSAVSFYVANWVRKFGKPFDGDEFEATMIDRVRKWGFNSVGAFSGGTGACAPASFPYVAHLPFGSWEGFTPIGGVPGTIDPFDEKMQKRVDAALARLAARADDPLLIGYYLSNEPILEDLPRVIPSLDGKHAVKRKLVEFLQQKYGTIDAYNTAWNAKAASFDALNDAGLDVATAAAAKDIHDFMDLFFNAYFDMIVTDFHKYDHNHMLIGNRLQPGTINNEQLVSISGKYLDLISFNYYTNFYDRDFLDRIEKWSGGKPMFLSEFYWSSSKDSGLSGGREVDNQQQRGLAYRNYVEQAAASGYIVGIEWFQLTDQPVTGRAFEGYHGESGNTGLFDVTDRPWKDAVAEMARTNDRIYDIEFGKEKPFMLDDPRFSQSGVVDNTAVIPRAPGAIKLDGTATGWPGVPPEAISSRRLAMGVNDGGVSATFRLCHDDQNLYVLVDVTDPTPMMNNHTGGDIWNGDGVELFIGTENPDEGGPMQFGDHQFLLSAGTVDGKHPTALAGSRTPFDGQNLVVPRADGKGYTLEAVIPLSTLGISSNQQRRLRFDLAVDDSETGNGRARQFVWNGNSRDSGDRSNWGHATLLP